jgi:hypothetical protein
MPPVSLTKENDSNQPGIKPGDISEYKYNDQKESLFRARSDKENENNAEYYVIQPLERLLF